MLILAFETISENVSASMVKDGLVIDSVVYPKTMAHAETILVTLETILARNSLTYGSFDLIGTITGPSSFIKIRVGLSVLYGLEFSTEKKILGVNLFEVYKSLLKHINTSFLQKDIILINAHQDNFYYCTQDEYGFIDRNNLDSILLKHDRCFVDEKSLDKLQDINFNTICLSQYITNLSSSLGIFLSECNKIDNFLDPKPFYIFDPIFKKKVLHS